MLRWTHCLMFGVGCALVTYLVMFRSEVSMSVEKIHVLERPMLVGANSEHAYYLLPAGVTLYWDGDMPEGFSRYKVYFNVEGQRLVEREQHVPGAIAPATLQPIHKEELIELLKLMKLTTKDVSAIISAAQFTDDDRRQIRSLLEQRSPNQ